MRLLIISLLFFIPTKILFSNPKMDINSIQSMDDLFNEDGFNILEEKLILHDRELFIAFHYIDDKKEVVDKALFYDYINDNLVPYLLLFDLQFINSENKIIADFTGSENIVGFKFNFAYPTDPIYEIGVEFSAFFQPGNYYSDTIGIDWNTMQEKFHLFDLSDYEY